MMRICVPRMLLCCICAITGSIAAQTSHAPATVSNPSPNPSNSTARQDNLSKVKELVNRQAEAWEKHDFGLAAVDWLPDGELISPGGHVKEKDLPKAMADYFVGFRDVRVTIKNVIVSPGGNKVAIEWDWEVTRRRDGARAVTHDAIVVDLAGGKISSWREYFDLGDSIEAKP